MVVAMHPTAAQVAADVLRVGGNAFDAAISLSAAVAVLCPDWAGVAGDSAWLLYRADTGEFLHLDGYSMCPSGMDAKWLADVFKLHRASAPRAFREEPPNCREVGVATSMVPGTPASWAALASRFATRRLEVLLAPAIRLAGEGFVVNRYLARSFALARAKLEAHGRSVRVFHEGGRFPEEGDLLEQPDLALTLARIAETETKAFYEGSVADRICAYSAAHSGAIASGDMASYRAIWRDARRGKYRDATVVTTVAPTAGVFLLQALAVLDNFDLATLGYHTPAALHCIIESVKQALNQRRLSGGAAETDGVDLLAVDCIGKMHAAIDERHVASFEDIERLGASTTHFVVRDAAGNLVTATQSLGSRFGCGEVVDATGLLMNDRSWWMSLSDGPNVVAPGRRANIGHTPAIVVESGKPVLALGSPGGFGILQYMVQTIVNICDHGLDVHDAIEAPRFRLEGLSRRVWIESRIASRTRSALRERGHEVVDYPGWTDRMGGVEGIQIDPTTGVILAGYDARRNSLAVGLE
jgi:gamma-glutamyltranspeptidase/glutathione hydrolase